MAGKAIWYETHLSSSSFALHAFDSFSARIPSGVLLFSKSTRLLLSPSSLDLIKSVGLVCILVNIDPLGPTCYFFVSISCDASMVNDQQFVCHKSSNLRGNRSDQVYNIQNKHSRYPPDQKTSHTLFERYSIPLQISDLTNNTQIHTHIGSLYESNFSLARSFSICSRRILIFISTAEAAARCHLASLCTRLHRSRRKWKWN